MRSEKLQKLTLAGVFAALTAIFTLLIQIPSPTKGYTNTGDVIVNLSAWVLGPVYGAAAAGIGSAMADLISGYTVYAPATLMIKAGMAAVSCLVYKRISGKQKSFPALFAGAAAAEIVMILGYAVFAGVLYGSLGSAVLSIPENIVQGVFGVAVSSAVYTALRRRSTKLHTVF